ncbi:hypothetical protein P3S68_027779 [Capsicum galapagoense]
MLILLLIGLLLCITRMRRRRRNNVHKMQKTKRNLKSRMLVVAKAMQGEVVRWNKN